MDYKGHLTDAEYRQLGSPPDWYMWPANGLWYNGNDYQTQFGKRSKDVCRHCGYRGDFGTQYEAQFLGAHSFAPHMVDDRGELSIVRSDDEDRMLVTRGEQ